MSFERPRVKSFVACFAVNLLLWLAASSSRAQQPKPYSQPPAGEYIKILEDPHRIERLDPTAIIRSLGLHAGDVAADIGSGSGLFTRQMARVVQPGGTIYAVDIDKDLLAHVARTARDQGIANIVTVLAREDSPTLKAASLDLALVCDTLHHISEKQTYLVNLKRCLKKDGRLAIIDFSDGWPEGHESMRFSVRDLDSWMDRAGLVKIAEYNSIPGNFFRIYRIAD
jgi:ubiquinone/menaquinone biosynthesis C-methylase UbiE